MAPRTVFIVDDDPAIRMSSERLLHSASLDVATFSSAREFLESYEPEMAGCVVSDIRMPEMSGIELLEELRDRACDIPVIVITGYADVPKAVSSMKAGAVDFIEKPVPPQILLDRIRNALAIDDATRGRENERHEIMRRMNTLTRREREVMGHIVDGKTSRVIADELDLSPKTIDVHRAEVMRKMGVKSIAQLAARVMTVRLRKPDGDKGAGRGAGRGA